MIFAFLRVARFVWMHPLSRSDKFAALRRLVSWQVGTRVLRQPVRLPFVNETVLVVERGMTGATGNWYCGLHEYEEMTFVLRFLREDDLFLDVGANVDSFSIMASGAVGVRTIAFEPIPDTFANLVRNVQANNLQERVEAHQVGVSECSGELQFTTNHDTVNHVLVPGEIGQSEPVPVVTLDSVVGDRRPALMKMDVEGHELAALSGASSVLNDTALKAVLLETNSSGARYGVSDDALTELMCVHGFSPFGYDAKNNRLGCGGSDPLNTIFIRDIEFVRRRLASASTYRLCNGSN